MKKIIIIFFLVSILYSCSNRKTPEPFSTQEDLSYEFQGDSLKADSIANDGGTIKLHDKSIGNTADYSYEKEREEADNMRGWDPASEDDMPDNGMSRYMENNDEEGWD